MPQGRPRARTQIRYGDDRVTDEARSDPETAPDDPEVGTEHAEKPDAEAPPEVDDQMRETDPPAEPPPADEGAPSYWLLAVVAVLAAALDLASKEWAREALHGLDPIRGKLREIVVVEGYFNFRYAENPGGAWSMLRSQPEIWRRPFFLFVSTAASVFICSLYARVSKSDWAMKWGLPLALGGAVGNLVDRVRHGFVVDFIQVYATWGGRERTWPTFNVADVWIVVGVVLMAYSMILGKSRLVPLDDEAPASPPDRLPKS